MILRTRRTRAEGGGRGDGMGEGWGGGVDLLLFKMHTKITQVDGVGINIARSKVHPTLNFFFLLCIAENALRKISFDEQ